MATMLGAARLANAPVSTVPYTQRDAQPVSIATFGAMSNPPPIMHPPGAELGRLGVSSLLGLLHAGEPPDPVLRTCLLVLGGSTGPVPEERLAALPVRHRLERSNTR